METANRKAKKELSILKSYAVFCSLFVFMLMVAFSLSLVFVKAQPQQTGCCEKTNDIPAAYCIDNIYLGNCTTSFHSFKSCRDIADCKRGVCVTDDGCQADKIKQECIDAGGYWELASKVEDVAKCKKGCCEVAGGIECSWLTKAECEELAGDRSFEFHEEIADDTACARLCKLEDKSTCVFADGLCSYTTRDVCGDNTFIEPIGTFPYKVQGCPNKHCKRVGCGTMEGDRDNICCFDSKGIQEQCEPHFATAEECDDECQKNTAKIKNCEADEMCKENETTKVSYCQSTSCNFELQGSQKLELDNHGEAEIINKGKTTLLHATSICYNFYTAYGDERMDGTSTGLQNEILRCEWGTVEVESLGPDRERLCEQGGGQLGSYHANIVENNYDKCTSCGGEASLGNTIGDIFGIALFRWPNLNELISHQCKKGECEDKNTGDCRFLSDIDLKEIGSCSPEYPPGTEDYCKECGGGGDKIYNLCTKAECYSLGNCHFTQYKKGENIANALLLSPLIYYGTRVQFVPVECGIAAVLGASCAIWGPACITATIWCGFEAPTSCWKCFPQRMNRYTFGLFPADPFAKRSGLGPIPGIAGKILGAVGKVFK